MVGKIVLLKIYFIVYFSHLISKGSAQMLWEIQSFKKSQLEDVLRYLLKITVILQGNIYSSSKPWVFNLLVFVVMLASLKHETATAFLVFYANIHTLCNMFLKSFISLFCVDDKTGLRYYIQKLAMQAIQEVRINSNFSVLLQVSFTELFIDCHRGELVGKELQTSSRCHTLV